MISVLLPAARDRERAVEIIALLRQNNYVSDIVLASPHFEIPGVTCVKDRFVGSARVLSLAFCRTKPETKFICWLSDICLPRPGSIDDLWRFVTTVTTTRPVLAEFRTWPPVTPGHYRVCTIYGKQYARWGMLSRKSIELIGGFFDPVFEAHYGDVDLSLRAWKAGGWVGTCTQAIIDIKGHTHPSTAPDSNDEAVFINRWKTDYPTIRTDNTAEWNVDQEIPE